MMIDLRAKSLIIAGTKPRVKLALALLLLAAGCLVTPSLRAEQARNVRIPLGIFAHINIEDALKRYKGPVTPAAQHAYLKAIYTDLLADPAISGLALGQHWDHIQVDDPKCVWTHSCAAGPAGFDWSYLDDAFAAANVAHKSIE